MFGKLVDRAIEKFALPNKIGALSCEGTGEVVAIGDLDLWDPSMTQLTLRTGTDTIVTTSVLNETLKGPAENPWDLQVGSHCVVWGREHRVVDCMPAENWKRYVESGGPSREISDIFLSMRNN